MQLIRDDGLWSSGSPIVTGTKNAVPQGTTLPTGLTQTLVQNDPGFANPSTRDFRLISSSPLRDAGTAVPQGPSGRPFPAPLALPLFHPPLGAIQAVGAAVARPSVGTIDLGAFEYGTATTPPPTPPSGSCKVSANSAWVSTSMASQTGTFTASWDVTPSAASLDGALGLSFGPQTAWSGLAAIVLFDVSGRILVRNGASYQAATTITYAAGQTYKVKMVVNPANRKYSVYVQSPGGAEILLANQYAFRNEQTNASQLNSWSIVQTVPSATLSACNFALQ
ncbi:Hypothetical protein CAP_2056 [Chondromyces apiculatus DSM 436]|uniref:Uncharacterized protein n=1 Tax=Chondromyces apiculatus DSM 436 TaxID=1192034 RepID=A0A017SSL8_9BACT|nr:Hypothetical protein CAP_2056 [Chondromyces apiculatus DSM 436]